MKSRSFVIACVALTALAASAQVHRCKDSTGKLMFSDRPCDIGQSGEQIIRKPSPAEIRREREQALEAEARKQDQRLAEQERELLQGQVLEDGDPTLLAAALGDIAKARGMTQLARDTGLSRESLYKSLSGERAPSSDTLFKVIHAMGFKLTLEPAHA